MEPAELRWALNESTWNNRAWTYQEGIFSSSLLFFTDYGVSHACNRGHWSLYFEGYREIEVLGFEVENFRLPDFRDSSIFDGMITEYSHRDLTYPEDIIRAFEGILSSTAGEHYYGVPVNDFDIGILWQPTQWNTTPRPSKGDTILPSWSWASWDRQIDCYSPGTMNFKGHDLGVAVARWARIELGGGCNGTLVAIPAKSNLIHKNWYRGDSVGKYFFPVLAGLAWMHGCFVPTPPISLVLDCTWKAYYTRIFEHWRSAAYFMEDSQEEYFGETGSWKSDSVFFAEDILLAAQPGRLLCYS